MYDTQSYEVAWFFFLSSIHVLKLTILVAFLAVNLQVSMGGVGLKMLALKTTKSSQQMIVKSALRQNKYYDREKMSKSGSRNLTNGVQKENSTDTELLSKNAFILPFSIIILLYVFKTSCVSERQIISESTRLKKSMHMSQKK